MASYISQKLRTVASPEALSAGLAPEPPGTFDPPEGVEHSKQVCTDETLRQAAKEWCSGVPLVTVEAKYGMSQGYIRQAMMRRFGSKEGMLEALENLVLENAVGAQMIAQEKLHELTGREAVFAGKLLVETMGSLRSQRENMPKTINFREFKALGDALKSVREIVGKPAQAREIAQTPQA
jgi:hypothetical protein